jgi:hypothetical protein
MTVPHSASAAELFVNFAGDKMTFLVEMVVVLSMN